MPFPEEMVKQAFQRVGGQCECTRRTHAHFYIPCGRPLVWENRGRVGEGGWEVHQITSYGSDVLSNCEILCWGCYEKTF
jgi:hypothetical protein